VEGVPGSVVFVSAGKRAVPLGVSRQLVGDAAFGAHGFRYCGSILAASGDGAFGDDPALVSAAESLAVAAAAELDLVGVNGVDFIARGSLPIAIEVNPRWPSSVELVERAVEDPVFAVHAEACMAGALPVRARPLRRVFGKAILFAREDVTAGDTRRWLADPDVRDIPSPGEHIRAGHPVCTVFVRAGTMSGCYAALVERADAVYAQLKRWAISADIPAQ
jgi:predicted ATP-grasp superfamily ATP-dependent carboligase